MMEKAESSSGLDLSLCPNALGFPPFSPSSIDKFVGDDCILLTRWHFLFSLDLDDDSHPFVLRACVAC